MVTEQKVVVDKPKKSATIFDKINAIRQAQFVEAFVAEFSVKPDEIANDFAFNLTSDQQLVYRNMSNRFKAVSESDVLKHNKKTNVIVFSDGSKYDLKEI